MHEQEDALASAIRVAQRLAGQVGEHHRLAGAGRGHDEGTPGAVVELVVDALDGPVLIRAQGDAAARDYDFFLGLSCYGDVFWGWPLALTSTWLSEPPDLRAGLAKARRDLLFFVLEGIDVAQRVEVDLAVWATQVVEAAELCGRRARDGLGLPEEARERRGCAVVLAVVVRGCYGVTSVSSATSPRSTRVGSMPA